MEKAKIQLDNANMTQLDGFVEAVCEELHLDNYYATVSVAVTKAVEYAFAKGNPSMSLACGRYYQGISFSLQCTDGTFANLTTDAAQLTNSPTSEMAFLLKTLADDLQGDTNGSTLHVHFAIQGISPRECSNRIAVLEKFYQPALIEA